MGSTNACCSNTTACESIWRCARSYDPARGAGAQWLYAVARNAIVDSLRRSPEPTAEPPDLPSEEAGPPEQTEAGWVAWRIHRALEVLPDHEVCNETRVAQLAPAGDPEDIT